jgi:hypothetical protein
MPLRELVHGSAGELFLFGLSCVKLGVGDVVVTENRHHFAGGRLSLSKHFAERFPESVQCTARSETGKATRRKLKTIAKNLRKNAPLQRVCCW